MQIQYYIQSSGKTRGPCTLAEMQQHIRRGRLSRFHKVSVNKGKTWAAASNFPELFPPPPKMHLPKPAAGTSQVQPAALGGHAPADREPSVFGLVNDPQPQQPQYQAEFAAQPATQPELEMSWYYSYQGEPLGPVSLQELQRQVQSGQVTAASMVWTDGLEAWVEAGRVELLFTANGEVAGQTAGMQSASPGAEGQPAQLAMASMILGLLGGCILPFIGSLLAVVFGHMALNQMRRTGVQKGRGLAIAGLILGYFLLTILLVSGIAVLAYLLMHTPAPAAVEP